MPSYIQFAQFFRNLLDARGLTIAQAKDLCGDKIPLVNFYQWVYGYRVPCSWQLKLLEQRMAFTTPYEKLTGEDKHGVRKKDRQLTLPGLREKR